MKKIMIDDVLHFVNAIGVSKAAYRLETGLKSENNRAYSDKIHSFGSNNNFESFLKDFAKYARDNGFQNSKLRLDKLTGDVFKSYLKDKIETKDINRHTVSNLVSQAEKLSLALQKLSLQKNNKESIFANKSQLIDIKKELRPLARKSIHVNRAINYDTAVKIINSISNEKSALSAGLQLQKGLREAEATKIKNWQVSDNLTIQTKGGMKLDKTIDKETLTKLENHIAKDGSFQNSRNSYETNLKKAFKDAGVKYKGTHTLRYTFAQKSYIDKIESGMDARTALKAVSAELGHHRPDITLHYLK